MADKINILSTKTLSLPQILKLDSGQFNLTSTDFITINPINFDVDKLKASATNWIITSKNALLLLFESVSDEILKNIDFYCVGENTAQLIKDKNLTLIVSKSSSKDLGECILKEHQNITFSFIVGSLRRNELPSLFTKNNVKFEEFNIYETVLVPQKIEDKLDAILFFSPSGIKSYLIKNIIEDEQIFCIGNTTATEAKKHSQNINIADSQTIEAVLEHTKQYYA